MTHTYLKSVTRLVGILHEEDKHDDFTNVSKTAVAFGNLTYVLTKDQVILSQARDAAIRAAHNGALLLISRDYTKQDIKDALLQEYTRASNKHPGRTLDVGDHTDATRIYAIGEEFGELMAGLTYDNLESTGHGSDFAAEVVQFVGLCLQLHVNLTNRT